VISTPGSYQVPFFHLDLHVADGSLKEAPIRFSQSSECVFLDADKLKWPLTVRSWKPGDRFSPLGMEGSKKIQDFFTDTKIPKSKRRYIPLLCDMEKICWIVGYRLDDRAAITSTTMRVLIVEVKT
jgi:tRNA(Ile)-lysidine synthase